MLTYADVRALSGRQQLQEVEQELSHVSAMLGASESEHTSTAGVAAASGGDAVSKAFYIRNNIGLWNAEKTQLMQDFSRQKELVGLLQLQHHSNTLEHELRTARRSGAADDSKRVTDHLAVDDSRRATVATRSTMPTTSYERRLPCPEPRDIHTAASAREEEEGHHSAKAKSAAHVCGQAGMKLRTYLSDIDAHKYLPTYTHRQAAVAASPYTGKQCHTDARAASRGIAPSPHVADTWLAQSDL